MTDPAAATALFRVAARTKSTDPVQLKACKKNRTRRSPPVHTSDAGRTWQQLIQTWKRAQ